MSGNAWLRLAWSGNGNAGVTAVTPNGQHRYARCKGEDCQRLPCVAYREGREDGFDDGFRAGYAAGAAAAAGK